MFQNREQLSMEFEERANKFYNMWLSESKAGDQLRSELAELRGKSEQLIELQREVARKHSIRIVLMTIICRSPNIGARLML